MNLAPGSMYAMLLGIRHIVVVASRPSVTYTRDGVSRVEWEEV